MVRTGESQVRLMVGGVALPFADACMDCDNNLLPVLRLNDPVCHLFLFYCCFFFDETMIQIVNETMIQIVDEMMIRIEFHFSMMNVFVLFCSLVNRTNAFRSHFQRR